MTSNELRATVGILELRDDLHIGVVEAPLWGASSNAGSTPIRQVTRNVKRWRDASMALRWTAAGMMEASKGFRRLNAYKQLPKLRDALLARHARRPSPTIPVLPTLARPRSCQPATPAHLQHRPGHPQLKCRLYGGSRAPPPTPPALSSSRSPYRCRS